MYFRLAFEPEILNGQPSHITIDIGASLEKKIESVRCYETQFGKKPYIFERIRAAAIMTGQAAGVAAGEVLVATRPIAVTDLIATVLPKGEHLS
jgi:LmbE family N-acetylglucosaminyl deacetylase